MDRALTIFVYVGQFYLLRLSILWPRTEGADRCREMKKNIWHTAQLNICNLT